MTVPTLEERMAAVEAEIARLKRERPAPPTEQPWWERIRGTFKDDPAYEEAMRLGREYRESLRPQGDEDDNGC
ncbi:MAG: hypothetical protein JO250_06030 [Armatimonadetes bacterium]|nr:hypothetical protein [Armatimonadota bacterium]